jgi:coenzyme F420-reducing hydrogenase gamma subunit
MFTARINFRLCQHDGSPYIHFVQYTLTASSTENGSSAFTATTVEFTYTTSVLHEVRVPAFTGMEGGADKIIPVDLKIPGNPPSPLEIIRALHGFMALLSRRNTKLYQ